MTDQATGGRRRWRPTPVPVAVALAVLAVALVAASTYFVIATRRTGADEDRRQDVLAAARQQAVNLTSQDYTSIDADLDRMVHGTTGALADDLGKQRSRYRDTFTKNKLKAQGSATDAALVTIRDRVATALVAVDQVVRSDVKDKQPQTRHYRLELDMTQVDGRWLASGLRAAGLVS